MLYQEIEENSEALLNFNVLGWFTAIIQIQRQECIFVFNYNYLLTSKNFFK